MRRWTMLLVCFGCACQPERPPAQTAHEHPLTTPGQDPHGEPAPSPASRNVSVPTPPADEVARSGSPTDGDGPLPSGGDNPPQPAGGDGRLLWQYGAGKDVAFKRASFRVDHIDASALQQAVALFQYNAMTDRGPGTQFRLSVHSNSRGSSGFNLKMSAMRAHALAQIIIAEGVNCKRIRAIGWGESKPVVCNDCDVSGKSQRVIIEPDDGLDQLTGGMSFDVCKALPD